MNEPLDIGTMNLSELLVALKISRGLVYKLMKQKKFPMPIKIGARSFWKKSDIESWISKQKAPKS